MRGAMTSRERVAAALRHEIPDRVPVDIGASSATGIQAVALDRLRRALGLEEKTVKVWEPMMMLGTVEEDVRAALGGDVVGIFSPVTLLGYRNERWKPWRLPNGTEVLMGEGFTCSSGPDGAVYAYAAGKASNGKAFAGKAAGPAGQPTAKMPSSGFYFDSIVRQEDLSRHTFDARADYADQLALFSEEDCRYYEKTSRALYDETECALFGNFWQGGLGDIFLLPAPWLERPRGIRRPEDFYMAFYDHPGYVKELFEMQTEVCLKNLELYRQAVQNRIAAIAVSGTDFGTQKAPLVSPEFYREFFKPHHSAMNEWIHLRTDWKVLFHSCGSIGAFVEDFIEAGVDVLNPVQFTAAGMDLAALKEKYEKRVVFWGGGIDTQRTLPFGTPDEVARETRANVGIMAKGGGFVCAAVHNIQGPTPPENIVAFFDAINDRCGGRGRSSIARHDRRP